YQNECFRRLVDLPEVHDLLLSRKNVTFPLALLPAAPPQDSGRSREVYLAPSYRNYRAKRPVRSTACQSRLFCPKEPAMELQFSDLPSYRLHPFRGQCPLTRGSLRNSHGSLRVDRNIARIRQEHHR